MSPSSESAKKDMEGCVMLCLSTFRRSGQAIEAAIERAKVTKKLMVVFVADVNLARYIIGAEHELISELKHSCEADLLLQHEKEGRQHAMEIAETARKDGIEVESHVKVGRFAVVCLDLVQQVKPSLIVTTRSQRPEWVRKFFGAPVAEFIAKAGCPVTVI
jgi:nucleotide-binding universal stress UspA family protein